MEHYLEGGVPGETGIEPEKLLEDDQMPRRRHRQKLGEPLHDPEDDSKQERHGTPFLLGRGSE